jgi:hypothetical protein
LGLRVGPGKEKQRVRDIRIPGYQDIRETSGYQGIRISGHQDIRPETKTQDA